MKRSLPLVRLLGFTWLVALAGVVYPQESPQLLDLGGGVSLDLVLIPAGSFTQGSPPGETDRGTDETERQVTLSRGFYLGKYPVTRRQYQQFTTETGYKTESEKGASGGFGFDGQNLVQRKEFNWRNPGFSQTDLDPVTGITFGDAEEFVRWLSRKTGRKVSLPTEAQWEYACRAGSTTPYYNGAGREQAVEIGWFKANAGDGTRPVGLKQPNAYGLYDMAGNVWEWCQDWYGPYEGGPVTDPVETRSNRSDKPRRVLRGGSWLKDVKNGRSAARFRSDPGSRNADTGFRIAVSTDPPQVAAQPAPQRAPERTVPGVERAPGEPVTVPQPATPAQQPPLAQEHRFEPTPVSNGFPRWVGMLCCIGLVPLAAVAVALLAFKILSPQGSKGDRADSRDSTPQRAAGAAAGLAGVGAGVGKRPQAGAPRGDIRLGTDGFWFHSPQAQEGWLIRFSYLIDNRPHSTEITYEPGPRGHFVFTGGTPTDVEIVEIRPADARPTGTGSVFVDDRPFFNDPTPAPSPPPRPAPEPRPFTGYPSAY